MSGETGKILAACRKEDIRVIRKFLEEGGDLLQIKDVNGKTPLHYCSENDTTELAEILLEAAPKIVDIKDNHGITALHMSTIVGNVEMIKTLIEQKANVNMADDERHTAVHWAIQYGQLESLETLISKGALVTECDIQRVYPLHYAAQTCGAAEYKDQGPKIIRALVKAGAQVNSVDSLGRIPLHWTVTIESEEGSETLLELGSNIEAQDKTGLTPLHCAASKGSIELTDLLVKKYSAKVDSLDTNNCTPLFYAVTLDHNKTVERLISLGADVNRTDKKGRTASHFAAAKNKAKSFKVLMKSGADPWIPNITGDTPLHEACYLSNDEMVNALLQSKDAKKHVDDRNARGQTSVHLCAVRQDFKTLKCLVRKGADINAQLQSANGSPRSAFDLAASPELKDVIRKSGGESAIIEVPEDQDEEQIDTGVKQDEIKSPEKVNKRDKAVVIPVAEIAVEEDEAESKEGKDESLNDSSDSHESKDGKLDKTNKESSSTASPDVDVGKGQIPNSSKKRDPKVEMRSSSSESIGSRESKERKKKTTTKESKEAKLSLSPDVGKVQRTKTSNNEDHKAEKRSSSNESTSSHGSKDRKKKVSSRKKKKPSAEKLSVEDDDQSGTHNGDLSDLTSETSTNRDKKVLKKENELHTKKEVKKVTEEKQKLPESVNGSIKAPSSKRKDSHDSDSSDFFKEENSETEELSSHKDKEAKQKMKNKDKSSKRDADTDDVNFEDVPRKSSLSHEEETDYQRSASSSRRESSQTNEKYEKSNTESGFEKESTRPVKKSDHHKYAKVKLDPSFKKDNVKSKTRSEKSSDSSKISDSRRPQSKSKKDSDKIHRTMSSKLESNNDHLESEKNASSTPRNSSTSKESSTASKSASTPRTALSTTPRTTDNSSTPRNRSNRSEKDRSKSPEKKRPTTASTSKSLEHKSAEISKNIAIQVRGSVANYEYIRFTARAIEAYGRNLIRNNAPTTMGFPIIKPESSAAKSPRRSRNRRRNQKSQSPTKSYPFQPARKQSRSRSRSGSLDSFKSSSSQKSYSSGSFDRDSSEDNERPATRAQQRQLRKGSPQKKSKGKENEASKRRPVTAASSFKRPMTAKKQRAADDAAKDKALRKAYAPMPISASTTS